MIFKLYNNQIVLHQFYGISKEIQKHGIKIIRFALILKEVKIFLDKQQKMLKCSSKKIIGK